MFDHGAFKNFFKVEYLFNPLKNLSKKLDQHWNYLWWKKRVVHLLKIKRVDDAAALYDEFSRREK